MFMSKGIAETPLLFLSKLELRKNKEKVIVHTFAS